MLADGFTGKNLRRHIGIYSVYIRWAYNIMQSLYTYAKVCAANFGHQKKCARTDFAQRWNARAKEAFNKCHPPATFLKRSKTSINLIIKLTCWVLRYPLLVFYISTLDSPLIAWDLIETNYLCTWFLWYHGARWACLINNQTYYIDHLPCYSI